MIAMHDGGGTSTDGRGHEAAEPVPPHLWRFALHQELLQAAAQEGRRYLEDLLQEGSIPFHAIEARAKSLTSYREKAERTNGHGSQKYSDPAAQIRDCVATRIIVFTTRAREDVVNVLKLRCAVAEHINPGEQKRNGYDSDHLIVTGLVEDAARRRYPRFTQFLETFAGLEIQVRTVAGHAWAEYEHDVRYKGVFKDLGDDVRGHVDQLFVEAGGLRRYLDQIFNQIDELVLPATTATSSAHESVATEAAVEDDDDIPMAPEPQTLLTDETLAEFIQERYQGAEVGDLGAVRELHAHLYHLGVESVDQLETLIVNNAGSDVAGRMDYPPNVAGVRQLDDELLAALEQRYLDSATSPERLQLLELRLRRVRGKFAIYNVGFAASWGHPEIGPKPAAAVVRELVKVLANNRGGDKVMIPGWISAEPDLLPSTKARVIKTKSGLIYVATNLSRDAAEWLMAVLLQRIPEGEAWIDRAGDRFLESGPGANSHITSRYE